MAALSVRGGKVLGGTVTVQGSKNIALPWICLAASLGVELTLSGVPRLSDVEILLEILAEKGCRCAWGRELVLDCRDMRDGELRDPRLRQIRMALPLAAGLAARFGACRLPIPQGDPIGPRPSGHVRDMCEQYGISFEVARGEIITHRRNLLPTRCLLKWPTHTASHSALILAAMAKGESRLEGLSQDPEVTSSTKVLEALGIPCRREGTTWIVSSGTPLPRATMAVGPDRAEWITLACASLMTGGSVHLEGSAWEGMEADLSALASCGIHAAAEFTGHCVTGSPSPSHLEAGAPPALYPDWVPLLTAFLCLAPGESRIIDRMYTERTHHLPVLRSMGADIHWEGHRIDIRGAASFRAVRARVPDIRAVASVLLAGLCADGETILEDAGVLLRGYEQLPEKLSALGADCHWEGVTA